MKYTLPALKPALLLALLLPMTTWAQSLQWETTRLSISIPPDRDKGAAEFRFQNIGTQPVIIKHTAAGCSCVTPQFEPRAYAPGESGVISLAVARKGRPSLRAFRIYVATNEKDIRPYELVVEVTEYAKKPPNH